MGDSVLLLCDTNVIGNKKAAIGSVNVLAK